MKKITYSTVITLWLCMISAFGNDRPNIVFILVDDMGYSDIGCYGGEVDTPNLNELAKSGLRFTSMYNTSKCFPSRACLLTGLYAQQVGMGKSSKQGFKNATTLAAVLKSEGYRTFAVGKHHSSESLHELGFDHFYGFYYGKGGQSSANHFNPGQQRSGEVVPARKKGESRIYCFDDKKMIPYYTPNEKNWYTTDYFTNWSLDFLEKYKDEKKPYFLYLSFTAPHDPLHAWPEDIAKYDGLYEQGYEGIQKARFNRQTEFGIVKKNTDLAPSTFRSWESLNEKQRKDQARRMQVYAAMIDRVDQNIGRLLQKIKELGEEENTLIMFASDNGCSAENVATGSGQIGSMGLWSSVQKDWANVSNTPFRYWKNQSHEGGIRTPFIVHWPKVIKEGGQVKRQPFHFIDVMATLRDITGAAYPDSFNGQKVKAMQGESFLPVLQGKDTKRQNPLFFEYARGGAIRDGKWKLVTKTFSKKKVAVNAIKWELYNLEDDMTETKDLVGQFPEKVKYLSNKWQEWYKRSYE